MQVFKLAHPPSHHWNPQSQHPATHKVQLLSIYLHGKWATTRLEDCNLIKKRAEVQWAVCSFFISQMDWHWTNKTQNSNQLLETFGDQTRPPYLQRHRVWPMMLAHGGMTSWQDRGKKRWKLNEADFILVTQSVSTFVQTNMLIAGIL